jgi:type VI secretion system secreted protein VgrG
LYSADAIKAQQDLLKQLDPKQEGKFDSAVNGHAAQRAQSGERDLDPAKPVERFGGAIAVIDSVDSINFATPASTLLFAGEQLHWTSGSDLHLTAGETYSSVAANAATMFTREGGIKAIAGNGDVTLQANAGELEILADKEVVVLSVNDGIEIKANKKIVLHAGQSSIVLEGDNITFACPGNFTVKSAKHDFQAGASKPALMPGLPTKLAKFAPTGPEKPGPHEITVMGFSAEGVALKDANVTFHDKKTGAIINESAIGATGLTPSFEQDKSIDFVSLIGFEGWSAQFEEIKEDNEIEEQESFDPGELDEDRSIEHL